ncbi:tRNA-dihydrouridine(47) synthase [NAD(P)(+)]-like protein [Coelomomyces lativittatus]|nr:tRNA-dihydrouridine(47) synthase [NAD(P)(+)]-like protein [Coelomomyces lativittatus]
MLEETSLCQGQGSLTSKIVEAHVKQEFLLSNPVLVKCSENHSLKDVKKTIVKREHETDNEDAENMDINNVKKIKKEEKKRFRGQNKPKDRPRDHVRETIQLCISMAMGQSCVRENCPLSHDIELYLASKGPGLPGPCPNFLENGNQCHFGLRCCFSNQHPPTTPVLKSEEFEKSTLAFTKEAQRLVRKKEISFQRTQQYLDSRSTADLSDVISLTCREKKASALDFRGKTYLAPLTTVGNLPFRRICKEFGVDITCGEMALASQLVDGRFSEWALTKRHSSETVFGVQIAGSKSAQVLNACELLQKYASFDFVDLNLGCPIDSVFGKGCGSALLDHPSKVHDLVSGMVSVLTCPVTVKLRTGVHIDKNVAHRYVSTFSDLVRVKYGVTMATIHGRSRQQRYRSSANWDYIYECARQKKHGMQVFGNGDVFHYQQYYDLLEKETSLDGIMVGRTALIKPWIFQEIKERRFIDISSSERLDMMRRYVQYGLAHWGTDTQGLETTRRFFLEFQSFHHRYIPVGLLEYPQQLNQRIPRFQGRDDMETLLGSPFVGDWIKLSELFLGPTPSGFRFVPKHRANADESKATHPVS